MPVPVLDEQNFSDVVLNSELPVLVDFFAEWCAPCKQIAPEVEAVATELEGKALVVKVDIDRCPNLAAQLRIQSVPTFMVINQGRPVDMQAGQMRRAQLKAMLEPHLPRQQGALKPAELAQLLQQGKVVPVDLREEIVYRRVHLPKAVSMPADTIETRLAELHMLPGVPVIYCRAGTESKELSSKLGAQGIQVAFLEGGLLAWEADGLPIERSNLASLQLSRLGAGAVEAGDLGDSLVDLSPVAIIICLSFR